MCHYLVILFLNILFFVLGACNRCNVAPILEFDIRDIAYIFLKLKLNYWIKTI